MFFRSIPLLACTVASAFAASSCPQIWSTISSDFTKAFIGNGQCTDLARGAIRFAFHDAGEYSSKTPFYEPAAGGADGSLLLIPEEITRSENAGLGFYYNWLVEKYAQYKDSDVGAADFIQFAGAVAIVSCPGGPRVKTVIGRKDTDRAAPEGLLPPGFGPGASQAALLQLFNDKGISAAELAALIGAHTASKAKAQEANGIPPNGPEDSTPGKWDVTYYSEVYNPPPGVYRFESDINLSKPNTTVGKVFQSFVGKQSLWTAAFAPAMAHLSVLGIPEDVQEGFIDCTDALPKGSVQRDIRAAPINERVR